jgi:hypothetical protein
VRISHARDWTIDQSTPASVYLVHVLVESELMQQVEDAAAAHRISVAAWVRQAMRALSIDDFPANWRAKETAGRSHESGYYHRKFQVCLDEASSQKLGTLTQMFHCSAADVIRQLIAQATPEVFPESWQMAVIERRAAP